MRLFEGLRCPSYGPGSCVRVDPVGVEPLEVLACEGGVGEEDEVQPGGLYAAGDRDGGHCEVFCMRMYVVVRLNLRVCVLYSEGCCANLRSESFWSESRPGI